MSMERLAAAMRSMVYRGKVAAAVVGSRTLLQITGLMNEVKVSVPLLLPPGMSARPLPGADVALFQVLGSRDHVVALGGDFAGQDAIAGLAPGEFGFRNSVSGTQMVFRNTGTIQVTGGIVTTGDVVAEGISLYTHVHGEVQSGGDDTGPPVGGGSGGGGGGGGGSGAASAALIMALG